MFVVNDGRRARDLSQDPIIQDEEEVRDEEANRPNEGAANQPTDGLANEPPHGSANGRPNVTVERGEGGGGAPGLLEDEDEEELQWQSPQGIIVGEQANYFFTAAKH